MHKSEPSAEPVSMRTLGLVIAVMRNMGTRIRSPAGSGVAAVDGTTSHR